MRLTKIEKVAIARVAGLVERSVKTQPPTNAEQEMAAAILTADCKHLRALLRRAEVLPSVTERRAAPYPW